MGVFLVYLTTTRLGSFLPHFFSPHFLKDFLLDVDHFFKVFIDFVPILLLFYVFVLARRHVGT